jgi:hypothetical protein
VYRAGFSAMIGFRETPCPVSVSNPEEIACGNKPNAIQPAALSLSLPFGISHAFADVKNTATQRQAAINRRFVNAPRRARNLSHDLTSFDISVAARFCPDDPLIYSYFIRIRNL